MLRFENNRALTLNNVQATQWGSIYRRSLVIRTKGEFLPDGEYDALSDEQKYNSGVFANDDTLKTFLESRPAAAAFFNVIYSFVNEHSIGRMPKDDRRLRTERRNYAGRNEAGA